jgi:hypothetical protein
MEWWDQGVNFYLAKIIVCTQYSNNRPFDFARPKLICVVAQLRCERTSSIHLPNHRANNLARPAQRRRIERWSPQRYQGWLLRTLLDALVEPSA